MLDVFDDIQNVTYVLGLHFTSTSSLTLETIQQGH